MTTLAYCGLCVLCFLQALFWGLGRAAYKNAIARGEENRKLLACCKATLASAEKIVAEDNATIDALERRVRELTAENERLRRGRAPREAGPN